MRHQMGLNQPSDFILSSVEELLEKTISKSRSLSHELSPAVLDYSGLMAAMKWLVRQTNERFGLKIKGAAA